MTSAGHQHVGQRLPAATREPQSDDLVIRVLGPVGCRHRRGHAVRGKLAGLLTTLVLHANRAVTIDVLLEVLWETEPPQSAIANVRTYVNMLRADLRGGPVEVDSQCCGYALNATTGTCDYLRFNELAARGDVALTRGAPLVAVELLEQALDLWHGECAAQGVPRNGPMAGWLATLEEERMRTVESLAEARIAVGEARLAARELGVLLARSPLRDRAWRLRMQSHHQLGEREAVVDCYRRATRLFRDELGMDPDPQLTRLYRFFLSGEDDQAAGAT